MHGRGERPGERAALAASLEGQLIAGKYRVERMIGVGGMGVVVSALHVDLERRVAIKLIRDELTRDPSTLQRFLLEARAAAKMTSEHVCSVLDVGRLDDGSPFIVMELLHGCDLGEILKERGRIEPTECVDWVLQACEGIAEAHALRIVHRDLKPDNLFMTRLGDGSVCVKVVDFGVSKVGGTNPGGRLTAPHTVVGSPRYMAPEQMLFATADERSDIWALGAILYELVSGTPAFAGNNVATICARVVNEAPVPPRARAPEVSPALERVILRCLERDPAARYPNVAALAADLAPLGSPAAADSQRRIAALLPQSSAAVVPVERATQAPLDQKRATRLLLTLDPTNATRTLLPAARRARLTWALAGVVIAAATAASWLALRNREPIVARGTAALSTAAASQASEAHPSAHESLPSAIGNSEAAPPQHEPEVSSSDKRSPFASGTLSVSRHPASPASPLVTGKLPDNPSAHDRHGSAPHPERHTPVQDAWDVSKFGGRE